jgi:hypothetical protein
MAKPKKDQRLRLFLEKKKAATMEELKNVARTDAGITIYRSLKRLSYHTSYSHGGRYYALSKMARFDDKGLWCARSAWFSQYGTLSATLEKLITLSERGCFAEELEDLLHVGVRESLLRLANKGRVSRQRVSRSYLYCSRSMAVRRRQLAAFCAREDDVGAIGVLAPDAIRDEVKAAVVLFAALLDERQRRLFAGLESLQFGRNAERWVADLLGVHRQTVAKGQRELLTGDIDFSRVRRKGAGRPRTEKKRPKS